MVEDRIMQFSPYISPIHLVFLLDKIHPEILTGSPSGGVKEGWSGENNLFSNFMRQYLENGSRRYRPKLLLMTVLIDIRSIDTKVDDLG